MEPVPVESPVPEPPAPEPSPPGPPSSCVLFLIQASERLTRARLGLAVLQIDQVIDRLLRRHASTLERAGRLKVGIIAYSGDKRSRKIRLVPLLPQVQKTSDLVPLPELLKSENRQLRLDAVKLGGKPNVADGLHHAYLLLHHWLSYHPDASPPLVVHWGDGHRCDGAHARISRSLRMLGSASGAVGLAHVVLMDEDRTFLGEPESALPRTLRRIWLHSSPIAMPVPVRALAVNRDPIPLVKALLKQPRPITIGDTETPGFKARVLSLPKRGNCEEEIEDAHAVDDVRATAALSDGASEGIFVRAWARLLTRSYIESRPDPMNPDARKAWLNACRKVWRQEIDFPNLRWSQQNRVSDTGGAATFLSLQLGKAADGGPAWKAWGVGDTCLFWLRDDRLRASFPLTHSRQFSNAPRLLATRTDVDDPAPLFAAGRCRKGDLFVLATDAVSQYLLRAGEKERRIAWNKLETIDEDVWRSRIEALRDRNNIVNDDCTMIVVRVT